MQDQHIPLVVDLDESFVRSDTLLEGFLLLLSKKPYMIFFYSFLALERQTASQGKTSPLLLGGSSVHSYKYRCRS